MRSHAAASPRLSEFASDVRQSLSQLPQRELPSKYFYDEVGSALFEAICALPEYGLSRAGERLLERHARELVDRIPPPVLVAELGSGSGKKTRHVLEAFGRRHPTTYFPIEISHAALLQSERELRHLGSISIVGLEREYLDGLLEVARRRAAGQRLLVLFLGSSLGNFDRPAADAFLNNIRATLRPGDALLLALDLEKPAEQLVRAYDDPAGVTAAFNMNLVCRINRELGGDFDVHRLEHLARYNRTERRVEMHLRSRVDQRVHIRDADFTFELRAGETIWTESSHKYGADEAGVMARRAGFTLGASWVDRDWAFGHYLLEVPAVS